MAQLPFTFRKAAKSADRPETAPGTTTPAAPSAPATSSETEPEGSATPKNTVPVRPRILSVSELQNLVRQDLESRYATIHVAGELSNFQLHDRSGHAYFTLKDQGASLKCVMWRDHIVRLRYRPKDGLQVIASGRLTVYERGGSMQLSVLRLEPQGLGALQLEYQQRVEKLRAEGLMARERKRPIPPHPRCIGIVTSRSGAALRDVLRTIFRRDPFAHVLLCFAPVQGRGAAFAVANALDRLNRLKRAEVIILARGGGSIEDLWCFNEEAVARAVARSPVPIVTGIGHETDTTIADLVADLRASTPTAAAECVVPLRSEARARIRALDERLSRAMTTQIAHAGRKLFELRTRLRDPFALIHRRAQFLDDAQTRMRQALLFKVRVENGRLRDLERAVERKNPATLLGAMHHHLALRALRLEQAAKSLRQRKHHHFLVLVGRLESLSPLAVLSRGYAVILDAEGKAVTDAQNVSPNDLITAVLRRGRLRAQVAQVIDVTPNADHNNT